MLLFLSLENKLIGKVQSLQVMKFQDKETIRISIAQPKRHGCEIGLCYGPMVLGQPYFLQSTWLHSHWEQWTFYANETFSFTPIESNGR